MTDPIKRTYINANEELIVRGKLTVEGEFVQRDTTIVESQTLFDGNTLVINSDGDSNTAKIELRTSGGNSAIISYTEGGNIEFDRSLHVVGTITADNISTSGDIDANISGNAGTATALKTARNFSITGDGSAPAVSFDGTSPVALNLTLADTTVNADTYGAAHTVAQFTVNSKGLLTNAADILIDINSSQVSDFDTASRALFGGGTGVDYNSSIGMFSIGQDVATNASVVFDTVTANSYFQSTANAFLSITDAGILFSVANSATAGSIDNLGLNFATSGTVSATILAGASLAITNDVIHSIDGNLTSAVSNNVNSQVVGNYTLAANNIVIDSTGIITAPLLQGQVSDISNHTTDTLTEGSSNLYYTDDRIDAHLTGGDGVTYANGDISVDSTVVRISGAQTIGGAKTFSEDVEIQGNLNVTANINSRTQVDLFVKDTSITLANGAVSPVDAQIFVEGGYANNPNIKWNASPQAWEFSNDGLNHQAIPATTDDLTEGNTNLYHTDARANSAIDAYLVSITANVDSVNGETGVVTLDTDDIPEGSNLYYTTSRVDAHLSGNTGIDYVAGAISVDSTVVRTLGDYELTGALSFAANAALKIPTTEVLEENSIYASGGEVFAYVGGVSRKLTPSVDVGDIETVGATGVEIYAGTRTEVVSNANIRFAGIKRLDAGNSVLITEASNVITVDANISSIREQFSAEKTAGLGNLTYNNSTGLFSYTGVTSTEIRGLFSNTGLITYNTSTGEIGSTADFYDSWTVETESANAAHAITSGSTLRILGGTNITVENDGANITIRNDNDADITAVIAGTGLTGGGVAGNVTLNVDMAQFDTDDLSEGNTNLYYTDVRARESVSASGDLSYSNATGVFSVTTYKSSDFDTDFSGKTTTDLGEGTNQYFSNARVNAFIQDNITTSDIDEGTNQYYTDVRARASVSLTQTPPANGNVFAVANISYSNSTGVFATSTISESDVRDLFSATSPMSYDANTGEFSITEVGDISSVTAGNGLVGGGTSGAVTLDIGAGTGISVNADNLEVDLSVFSTDDLSEGSNNLYHTVDRARVAVSADTSTGIDYNVTTGQFSLSSVPNDSISNNSITVNGVEFVLGDTNTVTANTTQTLTRGTYLTGLDFNGGTATTWAVDATSSSVADKVVARDVNGSFAANVVTATATQAQYADLAENYLADREYEPGTVLIISGDAEVTTTDVHCDTRVAGVVSTDPAHLMNSKLRGRTVVAIALRGRVPVKVQGPVHKGEVLITCERAGYACVAQDPASVPACAIIGKALTSHTASGSGVVEVMV